MMTESHGLIAEFERAEQLLEAVRRIRAAGYTRIDAYSPFALEGLAEALDLRATRLPFIILICGALGGVAAFLFQFYIAAMAYPLDVGGRPYNSWPAFMLVTFELTVLGAVLAAFLGMLAGNGLPQPYHPVFNDDGFARASQDRFFLCVERKDPRYDFEAIGQLLTDLQPLAIREVEP